jgi:hypothetical protein
MEPGVLDIAKAALETQIAIERGATHNLDRP